MWFIESRLLLFGRKCFLNLQGYEFLSSLHHVPNGRADRMKADLTLVNLTMLSLFLKSHFLGLISFSF